MDARSFAFAPRTALRTSWMPERSRYSAFAGLGIVVLLHVGVLAALLQFDATRSTLSAAAPIVFRLVTAEQPTSRIETPPKPLPIAPRVHHPEPVPPPRLVTAVTETASSAAPLPLVSPQVAEPQPAAVAPLAPVSPLVPVAAAAPAPVTPPSFNADYLDNPAPEYPAMSRRLREEGKVLLRVFVNEHGMPAEVQLNSSSGFARLDGVARDTVKHWRFLPARRGTEPVAAWVLVPVSFSLRS